MASDEKARDPRLHDRAVGLPDHGDDASSDLAGRGDSSDFGPSGAPGGQTLRTGMAMKIGPARAQLRFGTGERRVPVEVFPDPDLLGQALARQILAEAERARREGRTYLLGCPAGRSLRSTYRALAELAAEQEADLSQLVIAMMDEYLVETPRGHQLCPADAHYSCRGYGRREILDRIGDGLPPGRRIPQQNLWYPEPEDAMAYDERLRAAGGVDLFLAASGTSDGHVAFNPVGTTLAERTRVIRLSTATRRDNLETFPDFGSLDELPEFGVGVGLGTIVEQSRRVVLVLSGTEKRDAVLRLRRCADFTPAWPASFIYRCQRPIILLDRLACSAAENAS